MCMYLPPIHHAASRVYVMRAVVLVLSVVYTAAAGSLQVSEIRTQISGHPEYFEWIANYLVVKRISTQPNFHSLYLQFIDHLDAPGLSDAVLRSVFFNVGKLLRSSKIITSTSERS